MMARTVTDRRISDVVEAAVRELVSVRRINDSTFVNVPLIYPDGSFVTVRIDYLGDQFRVSDSGFAYRNLESVGAQDKFADTGKRVAKAVDVLRDKRKVFVDVPAEHLIRAICDVSLASWQITDRVFSRLSPEGELEVEDHLRARLIGIFGNKRVKKGSKIAGHSSEEWKVTAIVELDEVQTVFQGVNADAYSVYRTSAAFHDIAIIDNPPKLVSVVSRKKALGKKLDLLSQVSRIIEERQSDDVFKRAAA